MNHPYLGVDDRNCGVRMSRNATKTRAKQESTDEYTTYHRLPQTQRDWLQHGGVDQALVPDVHQAGVSPEEVGTEQRLGDISDGKLPQEMTGAENNRDRVNPICTGW